MNAVMDRSEANSIKGCATITTTLYDLVAAIQLVLGPHQTEQVVPTVAHMLRKRRVVFLSD